MFWHHIAEKYLRFTERNVVFYACYNETNVVTVKGWFFELFLSVLLFKNY